MKPSLSRRLCSRASALGGLFLAAGLLSATADGGDWPQWRGANRDGKATGFMAPNTWPKELKREWKVTVGEGVASPAVVGDNLYVFSWQGGKEVLRCLEAKTGKEVWKEEYDSAPATQPAQNFKGARGSPAIAEGKVVTFGAHGVVSCFDAASGKLAWRKPSTGTTPRFLTSCSPVIADGLCIVQIGGDSGGGVVAYSLANGDEKWKWTGDGTSYSSPVIVTVDKTPMVVAETSKNVVGLGLADGKLLWKTPCTGGRYNACTPIVDGDTVIFSGSKRGTCAVKIQKTADGFEAKNLWDNEDNNVIFNTPVLHEGHVYGQTNGDVLFCISEKDGKTEWTSKLGGGGGGGGKGMGKGQAGYGSIVDAGPVLFSLTPAGKLIAFEASDKNFKELASYKVGTRTYAYPVISGNRIFVKDDDSVMLYTVD